MPEPELGKAYIQIVPTADGIKKQMEGILGKVLPETGEEGGKETGKKFSGAFGDVLKADLVSSAVMSGIKALGNALKESVETGMAFDSSMSQVAATMGTTVAEIGELRDFAREMGAATAFSANQAADALNYMALAGYDAETSMEMLPTVLDLAAAGGMALANASDMITDSQSALGLSLDQTNELVDQMAKSASKSNTSVAQLGEAILTVGGTASYMSGGTEELNTVLGILADNGIKGSEAGTHLRNMLLSLSAPTEAAAATLDRFGVSIFDSQGNMRSFAEIFPELSEAMSGLTDQKKIDAFSTIFNSRDISSATALLKTSTRRWEELGGAISDSAGAAQQMAETQLDNLEGDVTLLKSAVEGAQIAIADKLNPALRWTVQFATNAVTAFTDLIDPAQKIGRALAGITEDMTSDNVLEKVQEAYAAVDEWKDKMDTAIEYGGNAIYQTQRYIEATEVLDALLSEQGTHDQFYAAIAEGTVSAAAAADLLQISLEDVQRGLESYRQSTAEAAEAADVLGDAEADAAAVINETVTAAYAAVESGGELRATYLELEAQLEATDVELDQDTRALVKQAMAALDLAATNQELTASYPGFAQAAEHAGVAVEALSQWLIDNGVTAEEWGGQVKSATDGVIHGFQELDTSLDMSLEEMASHLQSNIQAYRDWNQNIADLMAAAVKTGDQSAVDFVNYMMELGIGAAEQVALMHEDIGGTLEQFAPLFEQAADEGMLAVYNGIEGGKAQAVTAGEEVSDAANDALGSADTYGTGRNLTAGVAKGMRSNVGLVRAAGAYIANQANDAMKVTAMVQSPSRLTAITGAFLTKGVAMGMVSSDAIRSLHDAADKLTGETVADLKTMLDAWDKVYSSYYDNLKHTNFLLERNGGDVSEIVGNLRKAQETVREQAAHYRALGAAENSEYLRKLSEQWWEYADEIKKATTSASSKVVSDRKHSIFLMQKNGKSAGTMISAYRQIQTEAHRANEELRKLGVLENDEAMQSNQKTWWDAEDKIRELIQNSAQEAMDAARTMADALEREYQSAYNAIASAQEKLQDKLSDSIQLFGTYQGWDGQTKVYLEDLDSQTEKLLEWDSVMTALKERGAGEDLMARLLEADLDEGLSYGKKLMQMGQGQFESYLASFARSQEVSAQIAENWYQADYAQLDTAYIQKSIDGLGDLFNQYVKDLPESGELREGVMSILSAGFEELLQGLVAPMWANMEEAGRIPAFQVRDEAEERYAAAVQNILAQQRTTEEARTTEDYTALAAAITNGLITVFGTGADQSNETAQINIDGNKVADALLEPLLRIAKARGEVTMAWNS